jgi:nicotinamide-nucleotide amidase
LENSTKSTCSRFFFSEAWLKVRNDAEIILIGDELLKGERRDSHLQYLAEALGRVGIRIGICCVVGDEKERVAEIVRDRNSMARVLIICGGLGPTEDDITRDAVAEGLGQSLEFHESAWKIIQSYFASIGIEPADTNRKQAFFPAGASPLQNANGTAPGFSIEKNGCLVIVLPGPPHELIPMVEDDVLPRLRQIFQRPPIFTETFRTVAIGESTLASLLEEIIPQYSEFDFASLFSPSGADIIITDRTGAQDGQFLAKRAAAFGDDLRRILGYKYYANGSTSLEEVVGELIIEKKSTLSIAESLTGGLIGKRITDVPGSSRYFLADIVSYSNESKVEMLNVLPETLEQFGAVSEAVCAQMAKGAREKTNATWGLSTTGIAGPGGGSDEKPVGLCYYGLSWDGGEMVRRRIFRGGREIVRERVVYAALYLLYQHLVDG